MDEFNKILWIGYFETKTILRSKVFKIFFLTQFIFFLILTLSMSIQPNLTTNSSALPYFYILWLNFFQTYSIFIITANVFGNDRKCNAIPALSPRPFSNVGYILGKALGVASLFISVSILFTFFVFSAQFFFMETPVRYSYYFLYPLFIFLPTIIFTIGFTAFFTMLIRNEIITITLMVCFFTFLSPSIASKFPYLLDFTGKNLPMFSSDFAGFGNLKLIFLQRGVFVFAGIGFILISGLLFRLYRHPQSRQISQAALGLVVVCFTASSVLGYEYVNIKYAGKELRNSMRILEKSITDKQSLSMRSCNLDLLHKKNKIEVKASILVENNLKETASIYRFRLNPGLEVTSVESQGKQLKLERNFHILTIYPPTPLNSGETDSLVIKYRGKIDEKACYIDIDESEHEKNNATFHGNIIDKRYGFITKKYVLLTKEDQWYPLPFVPISPSIFNPKGRNFINFHLTVTTNNKLTAISQGKCLNNSPGKFTFKPEYPLTQISLVIGDFKKISTSIDGIEYAFYSYKRHDNFKGLEEISQKKLNELISELKQDYENQINLQYPFKRFSMIETPAQFIAHQRDWLLYAENTQPEQMFVPEKGCFYKNFSNKSYINFEKIFKKLRKSDYNLGKTDEELQCQILKHLIACNFFRTDNSAMYLNERISQGLRKQIYHEIGYKVKDRFLNDYDLLPFYYCYTNSFYSENCPLFDLLLAYYVKSKNEYRNYVHTGTGGLIGFSSYKEYKSPEIDFIIRKILSKYSLEDLIKHPDYKYFLYDILRRNSESTLALIKVQSGLDNFEFDNFIENYLKTRQFRNTPSEDFFDTLKTVFGIDGAKYFMNWQVSKKFPKFETSEVTRTDFIKDNHEVSSFNFKICNSGDTGGVFEVDVDGYYYQNTNHSFYLDKNQAKEINLIGGDIPPEMKGINITSYDSYNQKKSYFLYTTIDKKEENYIPPSEGERIIPYSGEKASLDTIITDDSNSGFKIVSQPKKSYLKKLMQKKWTDDLGISAFSAQRLPVEWEKCSDENFYGAPERTVYYKKSGIGDAKVSWDASLPSTGEYDVYYYTPSLKTLQIPHPFREINVVKEFHFFISHASGVEEVVLNILDTNEGWNYLGTYNFISNKAHVELTDKSKGKLVYADAVKFVKK